MKKPSAKGQPRGYAEGGKVTKVAKFADGGPVRQTEAERDKALGDYRRLRGEMRDAPPGIRESFRTDDKYKVEGGNPGAEAEAAMIRGLKRQTDSIDVDRAADAERRTWRERLPPGAPTAAMNQSFRAPGTADTGEYGLWPVKGPKLTEVGLAKGGKITRTAGPKVGKEDGLIAVQKGEYVVRKDATQKYGPAKMAAVNKGTARIETPKQVGRSTMRAPALAASNQKKGR